MVGQAISVDRFVIDPKVSRFTVRAYAGGMLSAFGHNPTFAVRDFAGDISFSPESLASASLTLTMKAASLALTDDVSASDKRTIERVMLEEVLEVARYPTIVYACAPGQVVITTRRPAQFEVALNGNLTLHGVTHPQALAPRASLTGDSLRAFGEFEIRQSDYEIKPVTVAGSMLKIKDELEYSFDIVARR